VVLDCWQNAIDADKKHPASNKRKVVVQRDEHILDGACEDSLPEKSQKNKNDAGGVSACFIIIRFATSIIELQSQLDVSWGLGAGNLAHG
jgi:hypothetical protein